MAMSDDHYQEDLNLTVEDFVGCGWIEALDGVARKCYSSTWITFSDVAKQLSKKAGDPIARCYSC